MAEVSEPLELSLDTEKICFLILKARAFDAKVEIVEPDPGSNPSDEDMRDVLEDYADDPTFEELTGLIEELNVDEQIDLVALVWLGRGDYTIADWDELRQEARDAHSDHTAAYLLGIPKLGDYLKEGFVATGGSCEIFEIRHL